jgi:hypothetical protein
MIMEVNVEKILSQCDPYETYNSTREIMLTIPTAIDRNIIISNTSMIFSCY